LKSGEGGYESLVLGSNVGDNSFICPLMMIVPYGWNMDWVLSVELYNNNQLLCIDDTLDILR